MSFVINQSVKQMNLKSKDYLLVDGENIKYDVSVINSFKDTLSNNLQNYFRDIEYGDYSNYPSYVLQYNRNKYKNVKRGYLCEISFNSLLNSSIFANVGPTIPIKLTYIGNINVNIELKTKEYGINNVIVEVIAVIDVVNQVSMPITTKKYNMVIKEPIAVDIVRGKVPYYYYS